MRLMNPAPWKLYPLLGFIVIGLSGCGGDGSSSSDPSNINAIAPDPPAVQGGSSGLAPSGDPPGDPPTISNADPPPGDPPGDPVPEPSTLSLLASGMAAFAILGRSALKKRKLQ